MLIDSSNWIGNHVTLLFLLVLKLEKVEIPGETKIRVPQTILRAASLIRNRQQLALLQWRNTMNVYS